MTASYATVEAAERSLDVNTARLAGTRARVKALIDERREIFRFLVEHGVAQAAVARRAKVTPMAVLEALQGSRRNAGKRAGARKGASS